MFLLSSHSAFMFRFVLSDTSIPDDALPVETSFNLAISPFSHRSVNDPMWKVSCAHYRTLRHAFSSALRATEIVEMQIRLYLKLGDDLTHFIGTT